MATTETLGGVDTRIDYVVRGESSIFYAADRERSYWPRDPHTVRIRDMRPIADQLSFDRNGFVLVDRPSAVRDFYDRDEVERVYVPEVVDLLRELTGAERTIHFGIMIRTDRPGEGDGGQPAFGAHVDYGDRTVRRFAERILRDEAEMWLKRRYMLINLWRPIRTVERTPLAVCDASTIPASDLFDSEIRGGLGDPGRESMFGYNIAYNPDHRWYYVPRMTPDEVLVFKLFDSQAGATQWSAHTAFADPTSPPDAAPRESIELRTISFMPE